VATDWAKYGTGWVKSGWLYIPERTHSHAVTFFKIHAFDDKTGYIHILDSANPTHKLWLETNTGFREEQTFCWDEHKDALRTALWQFTWQ
jgi:hypothetical protein